MASLIDENTQFLDSAGSPIVNGYIYVGTQNLDPVTNTITIYSDRELTVSISNPQRTDAYGRAVTRIWVPAKYSLKVEDENNVQQYLELDNGEIEQTGISLLTNVLGTDTITAEGAPAVTSLVDSQIYVFRAANAPTGAVTLQIDLTAAKGIKKRNNTAIAADDWASGQIVMVAYDSTDDVYELMSADNNIISSETTATNHIRAGNIQIPEGSQTLTPFDADANITESTWETVGPTGSGATNIWTDLDDIPATGTIAVIVVTVTLQRTTAGTCSMVGYFASADVTAVTSGGKVNHALTNPATGTTSSTGHYEVLVPLGANQDFQFQWQESGTTSITVNLGYQGFITD